MLNYLSFLVLMVTRYVSIYHGPKLDEIGEDILLKRVQVGLLASATVLTILEFGYFSNMEDTAFYQMKYLGHPKTDAKGEAVLMILFLIDIGSCHHLQKPFQTKQALYL